MNPRIAPECCQGSRPEAVTTLDAHKMRLEARLDAFDRLATHMWRLEDLRCVSSVQGRCLYQLDEDRLKLVLGLGMGR